MVGIYDKGHPLNKDALIYLFNSMDAYYSAT